MSLEGLSSGAKKKGLGLLGTGDFSHPLWFKELKGKLTPVGDTGLFRLRTDANETLFTLTNEVATFFSTPQGAKKTHHIIHAPSLEVVEQLNDVYSKMGNLMADGRPMFAKTSNPEFVEKSFEVSKDIMIYPAHAFTPWFGAFGSNSGYDSLEEAYGDQVKRIKALETGMSADPAMCWRMSQLDKFTLISNSDSHSNHPWRLGRECNAFSFAPGELSYAAIRAAIEQKDRDRFLFTVETPPAYGKYHWDGHRLCKFSCSPKESKKLGGKCPVCKQSMTIGVEYRIEELADRPEGFVPPEAIPFKALLPLHELITVLLGGTLSGKKVTLAADKLMAAFPSELDILLYAQATELIKHTDEAIVEAILLNREGKIAVKPGFDGEYGVPQLPDYLKSAKIERKSREKKLGTTIPKVQKSLDDF
jgi:uncharacterized protein (TIGR00375 family)